MKLKHIILTTTTYISLLLFLFGCSKVADKIDFNSDSFIKFNETDDCFELELPMGDTHTSDIKVEAYGDITDNDIICISEDTSIATISLILVHKNIIHYDIKAETIGETYVYIICDGESTSKLKVKVTEQLETTSETTSNTITGQLETISKSTSNIESLIFNKSLKGRGNSEEGHGRSEPSYVGEYGYVVPWNSYLTDNITTIENTPWYIPTYSKIDADHYEATNEYIEHKTVVKVLEQNLSHLRYDSFGGYLKVEIVKTGKIALINVGNFVTNDYWNYNILESLPYGKCLVKYHQVSDYLPVERNNKIVNLKDGQLLLTNNKSDLISGLDSSNRQVACYILNGANSTTDQGNEIFLNSDDIEIIY